MSPRCHHATKIRQALCRLGRRSRQAPPQSIPLKKGRAKAPSPHASCRSNKKRPHLGSVGAICAAWTEAHTQTHPKIVARELGKLAGSISPHELTPLHFQSLHARWKQRLDPCTIYHYTLALRRLVKHIAAIADRQDLNDLIIRARQPGPRRTIAAPDEIQKLVDAAPRWLRTIILLAADAAFRRADALRIAPIHYNAEKKTIAITQQKTGELVVVPVTERLAEALESAPPGDPATPFYQQWRGSPINPRGVTKAWHALKEKTGVNRDLWLHDLRRTIAVSLYEISKDLRVAEQMLGHKSLLSTVRYLEHRDPSKLRPYLDALHTPASKVVQ